MKRSEVIQIISNRLRELDIEPNDCDQEADKILKDLEKEGIESLRMQSCGCCFSEGWDE